MLTRGKVGFGLHPVNFFGGNQHSCKKRGKTSVQCGEVEPSCCSSLMEICSSGQTYVVPRRAAPPTPCFAPSPAAAASPSQIAISSLLRLSTLPSTWIYSSHINTTQPHVYMHFDYEEEYLLRKRVKCIYRHI